MLGVWEVEGGSSLNLAASSVLGSSTGHCTPENPEAEACVFPTGCFSSTETSFGISEASGVRTSLYYKLLPKYMYRWFSRYVIAAMLVDGKQKIAH